IHTAIHRATGTPMDQVETIRARQGGSEVFVYPAGHGFNCDQRGSYEAASAGIARDRTLDFLGQHVG
ncbi:MAG: dienelactone hydrolase family protein, partial [Thalassobaculaceae bacterium]